MNNVSIGLLAFSLLATPAFAESQAVTPVETAKPQNTRLYVGLDVFRGETNYEAVINGGSGDLDLDQDGFRLKFGAELQNNWRLQGYFKNEDVKLLNNDVHGLGLDLIKSFLESETFYPFILAGIGYDWTALKDELGITYSEDKINALNLKLGVGAAYRITNSIEVLGGLDWQQRSWQDIEIIGLNDKTTIEQKDTSKTLYLGLNVFF